MAHQLTRLDIKKMQDEIDYRKTELRQQLLQEVRETRAHGDLSENFEYHAAKREKNKNESRIRYLERMIKTSGIIEDDAEEGVAGINTTVTVLIEDDGSIEDYRIVTTVRGDSLNNKISIECPLGKALMGKRAGERAEVVVNAGTSYFVTVKAVRMTGEDEDERIRSF